MTERDGAGTSPLPVHVQAWLSQAASADSVKVNGQPAQLSPNPGWSNPSDGVVLNATVPVATGNQTFTVAAGSTTANYDLNVIGDLPKTPQYDNNGNCSLVGTPNGITSYEWDAEDRITAINDINSNHRTEFGYDGFGRRVSIVEKDNGFTTKTSSFVWDGMELLQRQETLGSANRVKTYYPEGMYVYDLISGTSNFVGSFFYERDHLGSIREMTDANQTILARYTYDPYGRVSGNLVTSTNSAAIVGPQPRNG